VGYSGKFRCSTWKGTLNVLKSWAKPVVCASWKHDRTDCNLHPGSLGGSDILRLVVAGVVVNSVLSSAISLISLYLYTSAASVFVMDSGAY